MSTFKLLILICALLVNTHSSPISEPPEDEDSPLPEANLENVESEKQVKESELLIPEKNETSTEEDLSYCNQFDNSCVKCVKSVNCSLAVATYLVQDEGADVQRTEYEQTCIDNNAPLKEITKQFGDKKYSILQKKSECESLHLENQKKPKVTNDETPAVMDVITSSDQSTVETATFDSTNATTNTTTKTTPTTSSTTTATSTTGSTTTTITSTSQNTSNATSSATTSQTSSTNSTQIPTTSKDTPTPKSSGGWSFWSFFGGILLTLGLSAIGFVGFKYYKARSGQVGGGGLNYNRF